MLKKISLLCIIIIALVSCVPGFQARKFDTVTGSLERFAYNIAGVGVGTVYHYLKSESDGAGSATVDIFLSAKNQSQSFKIYPWSRKNQAGTLVIGDYDTDNCTIRELNAYQLAKNNIRSLDGTLRISGGRTCTVSLTGRKAYSFELGHVPSYIFNFDLTDMNFFFRHVQDPLALLEVGIIGMDNRLNFMYSGKVSISFIKEEMYDSAPCYFYTIGGEAFNGKSGVLIVNKEKRYIVKMDIPLPTTAPYKSFKIELKSISVMTAEQWGAYMLEKTRAL